MKQYSYDHYDRIARKNEHILLTDAQHATEYRLAAADWVRSLIPNDQYGRWYPFILNSIKVPDEVADRADYYRRLAVIRACETATASLTKRAKGNRTRQDPNDAVRVIYVPAVKNGSVHLHGWCRVPLTDTTTARLHWKERHRISHKQYGYSGDAPSSLVRFSTDLCARLATKNIWWNLDEDKNLGSVEYAQRELKREKREWGMIELQPAYLFEERVA
jgi:hypothetical protein